MKLIVGVDFTLNFRHDNNLGSSFSWLLSAVQERFFMKIDDEQALYFILNTRERVSEKKGSEERIEEENEDVDGDDNCVEKREP